MYYAKKFVFIGPESTGKTTLCELLSKKYDSKYVYEYGRIFCEEKIKKMTAE
jgi:HTH-type transcriptional repressor of NAD biosynthesis genes